MTKTEFVSELRSRLEGLPEEDVQRFVDYYREMIEDRMEDGMSEEEAVRAVGTPEEVTAQILSETPLKKIVKNNYMKKEKKDLPVWLLAVLIATAVLWAPTLFGLAAGVLGVYASAWAVLGAFLAIGVACVPSGVVLIVQAAISGSGLYACLFVVGTGLFVLGVGLLFIMGSVSMIKLFVKAHKKLIFALKNKFLRCGKEKKQ